MHIYTNIPTESSRIQKMQEPELFYTGKNQWKLDNIIWLLHFTILDNLTSNRVDIARVIMFSRNDHSGFTIEITKRLIFLFPWNYFPQLVSTLNAWKPHYNLILSTPTRCINPPSTNNCLWNPKKVMSVFGLYPYPMGIVDH